MALATTSNYLAYVRRLKEEPEELDDLQVTTKQRKAIGSGWMCQLLLTLAVLSYPAAGQEWRAGQEFSLYRRERVVGGADTRARLKLYVRSTDPAGVRRLPDSVEEL